MSAVSAIQHSFYSAVHFHVVLVVSIENVIFVVHCEFFICWPNADDHISIAS